VGFGAITAPCGGGGGGFYSNGAADGRNAMPGGQGFRQGGRGALPTVYAALVNQGGFGGGATANFGGDCTTKAGAGGGFSGIGQTKQLTTNFLDLILLSLHT
jgi:hypothetical protein